ncbi:MAG TPA: PA0069 family radical SAM protein [Gammaproteobacteria bacterium]
MKPLKPHLLHKARGAVSNPDGRFESLRHEAFDDGWTRTEEEDGAVAHMQLLPDTAKTIINYNKSPDIHFSRSINPYRGCEHGCIYCFARPTHAYLGLSAGLDFETKLFYKQDAVRLLEAELQNPRYRCQPIAFGINTDAYQPVERELKLSRSLLEVLLRYRHPLSLITKSRLILRDLDILRTLAEHKLVSVMVSITSLETGVKSTLEPRAAAPAVRLEIIRELSAAGIPVGVMVAPIIPFITDNEMEAILQAAYAAGAREAGYVLLRLPHEVKELFDDWLRVHYPQKAEHVMSLMRQSHGGKEYAAQWGTRMRGTGQYAELLAQRFNKAYRAVGYPDRGMPELDTTQFKVTAETSGQLRLEL